MTKIIAIHGGGDWVDASVGYLVLPDGMDIQTEKDSWNKWYKNEYIPGLRSERKPAFIGLYEWCINHGARNPSPDELQIFEDI